MGTKKTEEFIGYSESGIAEAVDDALQKAGEHARIEVVETRGSKAKGDDQHYEVTLAAFDE